MTFDVGLVLGALFTLMIGSYLIGDNFLFRLAAHILIGAGAAYAAAAVIFDVFIARGTNPIVLVVGLILSVMLLFKASPRLAWIGNLPVGYLIGVGVATVLGGVVLGTLGPQIVATAHPAVAPSGEAIVAQSSSDPYSLYYFVLNLIVVIGTVVTLLSFGFYRASRTSVLGIVNLVGRRFFLMVALGATFALVFTASAALLFDRLEAVIRTFWSLPIGR
jgi:hypothetical protein